MSFGSYLNSWSNESIIYPGLKQRPLFGIHNSVFQIKIRTFKRCMKVIGKNVTFKELLYDLRRTFSLGLGESYFFLLQCFLLKIRDLLKVFSTYLEISTESMTTLIYPKTNPSTILIMFRGLLSSRILFLFHKYTIQVIWLPFHR